MSDWQPEGQASPPPNPERRPEGVDRLANLADDIARDPEVRRGARIFGTLIGIQMIIGIIAFIVVLIMFIIIATKVLGSSNAPPGVGSLVSVQLLDR